MGGENISESFSYNLKEREFVKQARKIAKDRDISFSRFVLEAIKEKIEKNELAQDIGAQIPILQANLVNTALDKYIPNWILNYKDWRTQNKIQADLDIDKQRQAYIALNNTVKRWALKLRDSG